MTDHPILFSAEMVATLIAGRKTQTRRVIKPAGRIPFEVRDRLWVREAWRTAAAYDDLKPSALGGEEAIRYEADGHWQTFGWPIPTKEGRLRPGMFMPRWASRMTLIVSDVRRQSIQDITEEDAIAEGCRPYWDYDNPTKMSGPNGTMHEMVPLKGPLDDFRNLWDRLNAPRGYGWDANPSITAVTFEACPRNIDNMEASA